MNRRAEQIASTLHRAVQGILSEGLSDPRLDGAMITVTSVKLDSDMGEAVVSVSVVPEKQQDLALHALKDAAGHVRHEAGERIDLRRTPRIIFKLDKTLKKQAQVLGALAEIRGGSPGTEDAGGDPSSVAPTLAQPTDRPPPPSPEDTAR